MSSKLWRGQHLYSSEAGDYVYTPRQSGLIQTVITTYLVRAAFGKHLIHQSRIAITTISQGS